MADLCEVVGADVHDVARGIGLDGRIGRKFLHPGPGFGGSCFPKDTRALSHSAHTAGKPSRIVDTVIAVNDERKKDMARRVVEQCGGSVKDKTVAILGVTFKPNTDDIREAPSLEIVPALQDAGAKIRAFDPEGMNNARQVLKDVTWCESAYEAAEGAQAVVIITEWNEFRALDLERMKELMASQVMVDLRNIYNPDEMAAAGFKYCGVGRPYAGTNTTP
jgi:UDPglucose 6-dehydrogenase